MGGKGDRITSPVSGLNFWISSPSLYIRWVTAVYMLAQIVVVNTWSCDTGSTDRQLPPPSSLKRSWVQLWISHFVTTSWESANDIWYTDLWRMLQWPRLSGRRVLLHAMTCCLHQMLDGRVQLPNRNTNTFPRNHLGVKISISGSKWGSRRFWAAICIIL